MARLPLPNLPPSLIDRYRQIITLTTPWPYNHTGAALNGHVFSPGSTPHAQTTMEKAAAAAAYLSKRFIPLATKKAKQDFQYERKREILSQDFPSEFWIELAPQYEKTQTGIITCTLDPTGQAIEYRDPNRRASWCAAYHVDTSYDDPAPRSAPPSPSAGWYSDTQNTQFQDRWCAQLLRTFVSDTDLFHTDAVPLWATITLNFELSSTSRGVAIWPSATIDSALATIFDAPNLLDRTYHGMLAPQYKYRFPLAPPTTPWAQTVSSTLSYPIPNPEATGIYDHAYRVILWLAPFTPHGRYFADNDSAGCWLTAEIHVFRARQAP